MRNKGWWAISFAMVFPVIVTLITASCAKKVVRTQTQTQTATPTPTPTRTETRPQTQPVSKPEPEVRKAPDTSAEKAGPAGRPEEARPRAEAAAREAAERAFVNEHVHFAFGSSVLSDQARQILHGKAQFLRTNPSIAVTVEGHCDDRGTDAYNIALGERRADSVKIFLVGLGIGTSRLNTVSYGEERPAATGHDEASWARNRRAQFLIKR